MGASTDAISIARSFLGYKEGANNDTIFGKEFGLNFVAWCVQFATGVYNRAGLKAGVDFPGTASTGADIAWYKKYNLFNSASSGYTPKAGDEIFFTDGTKPYHTGIVESVSNGFVNTIEGNAGAGSDSVVTNSYALTDKKIFGFGSPKFTGAGSVTEYPLDPQWWKDYLSQHGGFLTDPKMQQFYYKHLDILDPKASAASRQNFPGAAFTQDLAKMINGDLTPSQWAAQNIVPIAVTLGGAVLVFMGTAFLFGGSPVEIITNSIKGAE